jgi:hypothetical protein
MQSILTQNNRIPYCIIYYRKDGISSTTHDSSHELVSAYFVDSARASHKPFRLIPNR